MNQFQHIMGCNTDACANVLHCFVIHNCSKLEGTNGFMVPQLNSWGLFPPVPLVVAAMHGITTSTASVLTAASRLVFHPPLVSEKYLSWISGTSFLQDGRHFLTDATASNKSPKEKTKKNVYLSREIFWNSTPVITLAASGGKRNVSIYRPSVCLSRLYSDLSRVRGVFAHGAYSTWLTRRHHATWPAYISVRVLGRRTYLLVVTHMKLSYCTETADRAMRYVSWNLVKCCTTVKEIAV